MCFREMCTIILIILIVFKWGLQFPLHKKLLMLLNSTYVFNLKEMLLRIFQYFIVNSFSCLTTICMAELSRYWQCSKPSLIRLQLIWIEIWRLELLFAVELKDTWDLRGKRTFRLCWGKLQRPNPRKKISKIGLTWMEVTLDFSFWQSKKLMQWYFFIYFHQHYPYC
jgi:hypothetical protein